MATNKEEPSPKRSRLEEGDSQRSIVLNLNDYNDWVHDLPHEELVNIFELGVLVRESVSMTVDFNKKHMEEVIASKIKPIHDSVEKIKGEVNSEVAMCSTTVSKDVGTNITKMNDTMLNLKKSVSDQIQKIGTTLSGQVDTVAKKVMPLDTLTKGIEDSEKRLQVQLKECQAKLNEISNFLEKPNIKGSVGETTVEKIVKAHFPSFTVTPVSAQGKKADIWVETEEGRKIMIEVKNRRDSSVPKNEIDRFKEDLARSPDVKVGILFSLNSGIAKRAPRGMFEVAFDPSTKQYRIYVPNAMNDDKMIAWSVLMAEQLAEAQGEIQEVKLQGLRKICQKFCEDVGNSKDCRANLAALQRSVDKLKESITPILDTVEKAKKDIDNLLKD